MLTGITWSPAATSFVPANFAPVAGDAVSQDFLVYMYLIGYV